MVELQARNLVTHPYLAKVIFGPSKIKLVLEFYERGEIKFIYSNCEDILTNDNGQY